MCRLFLCWFWGRLGGWMWGPVRWSARRGCRAQTACSSGPPAPVGRLRWRQLWAGSSSSFCPGAAKLGTVCVGQKNRRKIRCLRAKQPEMHEDGIPPALVVESCVVWGMFDVPRRLRATLLDPLSRRELRSQDERLARAFVAARGSFVSSQCCVLLAPLHLVPVGLSNFPPTMMGVSFGRVWRSRRDRFVPGCLPTRVCSPQDGQVAETIRALASLAAGRHLAETRRQLFLH